MSVDRLALVNGTDLLLLVDGTSHLLLASSTGTGVTPLPDPTPHARTYALDTTRTYVIDAQRTYVSR